MTMRKLMIAAAAACGAVAIGYGALTIAPGESQAQGAAPALPQANESGNVGGPRECDRAAGIDRDCTYQ